MSEPLRDYLAARGDFDQTRRAAIELIDRAEELLRQPARGTVQQFVEAQVTFELLAAVPWDDVRDLLGAGPTTGALDTDTFLTAYRHRRGSEVAAEALTTLNDLRQELAIVPGTDPAAEPRRQRLLARVGRIAIAVAVAGLVAAPISAYLVDEHVIKEVVKTVVATLIVTCVTEFVTAVRKPPTATSGNFTPSLTDASRSYHERVSALGPDDLFQLCAAKIQFIAAVTRAHDLRAAHDANHGRSRELWDLTTAIVADDTATLSRCLSPSDPLTPTTSAGSHVTRAPRSPTPQPTPVPEPPLPLPTTLRQEPRPTLPTSTDPARSTMGAPQPEPHVPAPHPGFGLTIDGPGW